MISKEFIQNGYSGLYISEDTNDFLIYIETVSNEFDEIVNSQQYKEDMNQFNSLFGESVNDEVYTEGAADTIKSAITALGEFIKSIFKKLGELIDNIVQKVKDLSFRFKSAEKKMDMLLKQHPELKDEEICRIKDLSFNDMKSINDLEKEYYQCIALLEVEKNPKTVRAKWEKAKRDYQRGNSSLHKAANAAKIITAITAVPTALFALKQLSGRNREENRKKQREKAESYCRRKTNHIKKFMDSHPDRNDAFFKTASPEERAKINKRVRDEAERDWLNQVSDSISLAKEIMQDMVMTEGEFATAGSRFVLKIRESIDSFLSRYSNEHDYKSHKKAERTIEKYDYINSANGNKNSVIGGK